ncbi:MAG TPA: PKD domain-containing protein [Bacteroidales bacterium]|nr:PKD domain-containing protein [Bacteroidales bacterium]
MKTRFPLLIATLFAVAAIQVVHAQDDVYGPGSNTSTQAKPTKHNGKKITTGYVFIDGKYVEPPYRVKCKDMGVYINNYLIINYSDRYKSEKNRYLSDRCNKRPIVPSTITDSSGANDFYHSREVITGKLLLYSIHDYYYHLFTSKTANDSICAFLESLPNVLLLERESESMLTLTLKNGDITKIILENQSKDKTNLLHSKNSNGKIKKEYLSRTSKIRTDIKRNIREGEVVFFWSSAYNNRVILSPEELKKIISVYASDLDYETKLDSLCNLFRRDKEQIEIFLKNFRLPETLKQRLQEETNSVSYKNGEQTQVRNNWADKPSSQNENIGERSVEIAFCPSNNSIAGYCPSTWDNSAQDFEFVTIPRILNYVQNQGYHLSWSDIKMDKTPNDEDIDFGDCTYQSLKDMASGSGIVYFHAHGNQEGYILVQSASDSESLRQWCNNDLSYVTIRAFSDKPVGWNENYPYFGAFVNYTFFQEFWKVPLTESKAIVLISTCYGAIGNLLESYGGGFTMAYPGETAWNYGTIFPSGVSYNLKHLLLRMNGSINNGNSRYSVVAFESIPNPADNVSIHSNYSITLCPSTKTIFPANNSIVPSAVTQGYFEIDTWCDATIPANQALTFSTTGNIQINANTGVYWENGTSGKSNKIIYEWTGTQGSVTVHVHTDKIVAYGGGGQRLDFDRVAPNGETGVYYVFQIGSGTAQYVDFFAENTNILENTPVQFTNTSSLDDPISYNWDFGDGGTSNQQNPVHAYTTSGVYDVSLTVATPIGNLYKGKTSYISVYNESSGDLSCTNFVLYDKTVQFNASFIGAYEPYAFEYRFTIDYGDGNTDTQQGISPFADFTYEYMEYADYETTVFVEVLSQFDDVIYAVGCDCGNVGLYNPFPCSNFEADFTYSPEIGYLTGGSQNHSVTINFYNSTSGGTNYSGTWYFLGDLENDYEPLGGITNEGFVEAWGHNGNPQPKTYTQPGIYPVALDVWDQNGCFDNITKYIHIEEPLHCINNLKIHSSGSDQLWNSNRLIVPWMHNNHDCSINLFHDFNLTTFCAHCDCATCGERPQRYRWYVNGEKIVEGIDDGATIILGHSYETDFELSTQQYILPYKNTVSCTIEGDLFHTVSDNFSSSCYDSTHIELIAIYCDGFMNSNDFNFARMAHSNPLLPPFTEHGFMINNGNTKEFFSGTMALNYGVNTVVGNHDVVLYACNEIVLTDGFIAGNRSFVAYAGIDGNTIEGCHQIQYANNRIADKVSEVDMETKKRASLDVVPNPVSENFRVVVNHPFDDFLLLQIFDSHGRFIQELSNSNQTAGFCVFQVTNFNVSPGLYFCRYTNSQNSITRKFIKKQTHDK